MEILISILNDKGNRENWVRQFQEYIWNKNPRFNNVEEEDILSDLAYDLDFYQPDMKVRKEDPSYYGDDRLEAEIKTALEKLGVDYA